MEQKARPTKMKIFRGTPSEGGLKDYEVEVAPGMVVLDAVLKIQAEQEPQMAVRWNCKAGKCGSCGAEVNGKPRLMCMTRFSALPDDRPVIVEPLKAFRVKKDLVCDVSWNYEVDRKIPPFVPQAPGPDGWRMMQRDVDRIQEFRKCIQCWLCQDVCHVIRNHDQKPHFVGPAFFVKLAYLEMHPLDQQDRREFLKDVGGLGYCNITKCCTEVCPEHITITDNAIIPLKERGADRYWDPVARLLELVRKERSQRPKVHH